MFLWLLRLAIIVAFVDHYLQIWHPLCLSTELFQGLCSHKLQGTRDQNTLSKLQAMKVSTPESTSKNKPYGLRINSLGTKVERFVDASFSHKDNITFRNVVVILATWLLQVWSRMLDWEIKLKLKRTHAFFAGNICDSLPLRSFCRGLLCQESDDYIITCLLSNLNRITRTELNEKLRLCGHKLMSLCNECNSFKW